MTSRHRREVAQRIQDELLATDDLGNAKYKATGAVYAQDKAGNQFEIATVMEILFLCEIVRAAIENERKNGMNEFVIQMGITFVLTAIRESFKNPTSKAHLKAAFLKIRNQINMLYIDDPDFNPPA